MTLQWRWRSPAWFGGARRLLLIVGFDALLILLSLYTAYLLRFDGGPIPADHRAILTRFLPVFLALRLSLHLVFGLHRWSFRLSGLHEALRVVSATLAGTTVFVAVFYFLQTPGPPRSVLVMEFFLTASLVGFFRFSPRFAQTWLLAQSRSRSFNSTRSARAGTSSASITASTARAAEAARGCPPYVVA